jgi:hypothetical protein
MRNIPEEIDRFTERWVAAQFGPAHIVLADYNVDDDNIEHCLACIDQYDPGDYGQLHDPEELEATKAFLQYLRSIPEEERWESVCRYRPYMCEEEGEE